MFTKAFWKDAIERAVGAASAAVISAGVFGEGFNLFDLDLGSGAGVAAGAAVLSILKSLGVSNALGRKGTASVTKDVTYTEESVR